MDGVDHVTRAKQRNLDVVDLVVELERKGGFNSVNFCMGEEDVRNFMKEPFVATASDGHAMVPSASVPHPRSYGTFPRKLRQYVFDEKVLDLPHAAEDAAVRQRALALGYNEAVSLTFISHADAKKFSSARVLELENPLSEEASVMRTSVIQLPGLVESLRHFRRRRPLL